MFYTKYRPQKFSEILRPNEAADALTKQVRTGKTVHAYLFVGPRGIGKTTIARVLAKALNCTKLGKDGEPCGKCGACEGIANGSFVDLMEIDAASNRGVDDIRDLRDKVKLAPTAGKHKVYIIDEVHMLTHEAFNALLKTLEEPPKNVTFILCTTEFHKVPETIRSRCQVFKMKRATISQQVAKLKGIAKKEKIDITEVDMRKLAKAALGSFRDAETLLQQVAEGGVSVDALLNTSSKDVYADFVEYLINKQAGEAVHLVGRAYDEGIDMYIWVGELLKYLRDLLFIGSGSRIDAGDVTEEILEAIEKQAKAVDTSWIINSLEKFVHAHAKTRGAFIPQLPVEIAIVEICGGDSSVSTFSTPISPVPSADTSKKSGKKRSEAKPKSETKDKSSPKKTTFSFTTVRKKWSDVVAVVSKTNGSTTALIKSGKPLRAEGKFLILEVAYAFHKERLESPKNRAIIENAIQEVCNNDINIKCEVNGNTRPKKMKEGEVGVLTDHNVNVVDSKSVIEMLDGGLPV
ncbi:DNA polymerase III subunit gamma/tau [bacterium]|nr:DNA polymerase III subunit gamma/tau [bacterium]